MTQGILLVGRGSRDEAGNRQFLQLAAQVALRLPRVLVEPCFLDHAEPAVPATIERLVQRGAGHVGVVPLFLFDAGHGLRDVPLLVRQAQTRYPEVRFRYGRVLGVHWALVKACADALAATGDLADSIVLLVGRGSSYAEANADLWKVARLLWEEAHCAFVTCAYSGVTEPTIAEGLERCVQFGARRVVVVPYFLFRGVLMDRLKALVASWQERFPDREFLMAGMEGLGQHPAVLDLVVVRATETLG